MEEESEQKHFDDTKKLIKNKISNTLHNSDVKL
jgi:hypothetical protein